MVRNQELSFTRVLIPSTLLKLTLRLGRDNCLIAYSTLDLACSTAARTP